MSLATGRQPANTTALAGEALLVGQMGAVKPADGKIYNATDIAGEIGVGVITENADSGDKVAIDREHAYWIDNSGTTAIAVANIGTLAYVEDATTVTTAAGSSTNLIAGLILGIDTNYGVLVDFRVKTTDVASA